MNSLRGPIPDAVASATGMRFFQCSITTAYVVRFQMLSGPGLNCASCSLGDNSLRGPIPQALESKPKLGWFHVERNSLSGTIPAALTVSWGHTYILCI